MTIELPDDLEFRLKPFAHQLPQIVELGLREWKASTQMGYDGAAEVLEYLAQLPTPEEVLNLQPSET